jgi:hypothetical protein
MVAGAPVALVLVCATTAGAAPVSPTTAVLGADDVAGLAVGPVSTAPWLGLVSRHSASGSRASASVLRSSGTPRLLIVSRAAVAPDGEHAKALKRALAAVGRTKADRVDARALGVPMSTVRRARRIVWRDGPVVAQLVIVGVAKGDALVARLQATVRARVRRAMARTAWEALLARVAAHGGRPDAAKALKAFALAVAPLPGVRVPKGRRGSIPEGTLATSWVLANYGSLTPGVRRGVDRVLRRAFGLSGPAAPAGRRLNAVKARAIAFVGRQAGVAVTLPITVVRGYPSSASGAAALGVDASGRYRSSKPAARCIISVRRTGASRTVIGHEVFHCLQIQLTRRANGLQALDADRAWLGEGSASYAGCLFSQDGGAPYRKAYAGYVEEPLTPLSRRTYDAIGFFAHLDQSGAGALGTVRRAIATPSLASAYPAVANAGGADIFGTWASSLYRTPARGGAWDVSGPCAPPRSRAATPTPIVLAGSGPVTLSAPAYAAHPYELFADNTTAGAITVHRASGHVRVAADGIDAEPTVDAVYCLGRSTAAKAAIALTGGERGAKVTIATTNTAAACGPRGSATCQRQLCLAFGASSPPGGAAPPGTPPRGPHVNRIPEENAKPGTDPAIWDISGAGDASIQGYTADISYDLGQTVQFKIQTPATSYRLDIYRMGYYQGNGARLVDRIQATGPQNASTPCMTAGYPGLVDCGNWNVSATWAIPADAVSGIYFAHLVREDLAPGDNRESHVFFVVRDDSSTSDVYFQTSDTTWQAYNQYGGESLYTGGPLTDPDRAAAVSYNRPFATRSNGPEDFVFNAEYPMVRWLERNGYDVSYETGVDTDRYGALIRNHRLFMSTGHDEYWSGQQRSNVEAARDAGVNLAFFSGNEVFWKTRWDNDHRTLVSYKETHDPTADIDPSSEWTGSWRDPRTTQAGIRPENELTGQLFTVNAGTTAIAVPAAYRSLPFWRHIPAASWSQPLPDGTLGYEWDSDRVSGLPAGARPPTFTQPSGLTELSSTTVSPVDLIQDYGHSYATGSATHNLTLYTAPSGALVFGAGTVQWSWGLDGIHDRGGSTPDAKMQQATVNLFSDMHAEPATLQNGLVPG